VPAPVEPGERMPSPAAALRRPLSAAAPRLRRPPRRAVLVVLVALVLAAGAWLWLRDSSLVAVRDVTVTGVSGPQAQRVRAALAVAARDMTTLHVRLDALRTAVEPYPVVRNLEARPDFPHGLRIVVHEHVAVGALVGPGRRLPVAADGTILRDTPADGLPAIAAARDPGTETVLDAQTKRFVAFLAAAPGALRTRVARVYLGPRGLTAPLTDGPVLYFGDSQRLAAKWAAATRVLADASSRGASYLDLRLPERPAAGGLESPQPQDPPASATPGP
jgi:cell division protein FtsQ